MNGEGKRWRNSLFGPFGGKVGEAIWQPATDVYRTPEGWLVKLDLAGVRPEDIQVSVRGSCLIVQGTRRDWTREEGCCHYRMEIAYSHFERQITLPDDLEHARIRLEQRQGMLLVRIQQEADQR